MHTHKIVSLLAVLAAAVPSAAYVAMPTALARPGGLNMGLSSRKATSAPTMQLNPSDKSFRRASVALRAEGQDETDPTIGGGYVASLCMLVSV